jgi:hypothetical protein
MSSDCAPSSEGNVDCTSSFSGGSFSDRFCQVRARGAEGGACVGEVQGGTTITSGAGDAPSVTVCYEADGLYCDLSSKTCKAYSDPGGPCSGGQGCKEGAYCAESICTAQVPAGGDCSLDSDACDATSYCSFPDSLCTSRLENGSACESYEECLSDNCGSDGVCESAGSLGNLGLLFLCQ